jgi:serine O-acetyltransferase
LTKPSRADQIVESSALEDSLTETLFHQLQRSTPALPSKREVEDFVDKILALFFPQNGGNPRATRGDVLSRLASLQADLAHMLSKVVPGERSPELAEEFCQLLPGTYELLRADAEAIVAGDPAAESLEEVIAAYPGYLAITVHRLAHGLHALAVPIVPRLLAEVAHTRTGIDIHPGARIGRAFCIDHGTGIVIGETAVIGDEVKIYQGVTLGALSVVKSIAGKKRHPTIEDRVVIYANATVLGGDTTVGHDSIVGGNVWITTSVPPRSYVHQTSQVSVRSVADTLDPLDYSI